MKRKNYLIKCSNGTTAIKHSWNAAVRHIESAVRDGCMAGESFALVASESLKNDAGEHIKGFREWKSDQRSLAFAIHKLKELNA